MTVLGVAASTAHEHVPQLIEVAYDENGHVVRELVCGTCSDVWFE